MKVSDAPRDNFCLRLTFFPIGFVSQSLFSQYVSKIVSYIASNLFYCNKDKHVLVQVQSKAFFISFRKGIA